MKKFWEKFLKFLRDPAVPTILTALTLVGAVIWGAIQGWLKTLITWLTRSSPWLNWSSLLLIVMTLLLGGFWIKTKFRKTKTMSEMKPNKMIYHEVWGVLWGWPPIGNRYVGDGPLCPHHKLPVDVDEETIKGKRVFVFFCPGSEGKKSHIIKGPARSQLVGSKGEDWTDVNILADVNARLRAQEINRR